MYTFFGIVSFVVALKTNQNIKIYRAEDMKVEIECEKHRMNNIICIKMGDNIRPWKWWTLSEIRAARVSWWCTLLYLVFILYAVFFSSSLYLTNIFLFLFLCVYSKVLLILSICWLSLSDFISSSQCRFFFSRSFCPFIGVDWLWCT